MTKTRLKHLVRILQAVKRQIPNTILSLSQPSTIYVTVSLFYLLFPSFVFTCAENLVDEYTQSLKKSEQLKDAAPGYPEEREESNTVEPEQELLEDDDSPAAEERNPIPEYQNFTPEDNSAAEIAQNYQGETEVN